jgi:hypothetical protein
MDGKLLIEGESPLQLQRTLAVKVGLLEAIVLQQIHYLLTKSKHEFEGQRWIFNGFKEWGEYFPFICDRTLRQVFTDLENPFTPAGKGKRKDKRPSRPALLKTGNFHKNKWNQKKWYTIDYAALETLLQTINPSGKDCHMEASGPCGKDYHMHAAEITTCNRQSLPHGSGNDCHMEAAKITGCKTKEIPSSPSEKKVPSTDFLGAAGAAPCAAGAAQSTRAYARGNPAPAGLVSAPADTEDSDLIISSSQSQAEGSLRLPLKEQVSQVPIKEQAPTGHSTPEEPSSPMEPLAPTGQAPEKVQLPDQITWGHIPRDSKQYITDILNRKPDDVEKKELLDFLTRHKAEFKPIDLQEAIERAGWDFEKKGHKGQSITMAWIVRAAERILEKQQEEQEKGERVKAATGV